MVWAHLCGVIHFEIMFQAIPKQNAERAPTTIRNVAPTHNNAKKR